MPAINDKTAAFWRDMAKELSEQRPSPGKRVRIDGGRKHQGREGIVVHHCLDRYSSAFRYGGDANLHMREMAGRSGFVILVRTDDGTEFWCKADYATVLTGSQEPKEREDGTPN